MILVFFTIDLIKILLMVAGWASLGRRLAFVDVSAFAAYPFYLFGLGS